MHSLLSFNDEARLTIPESLSREVAVRFVIGHANVMHARLAELIGFVKETLQSLSEESVGGLLDEFGIATTCETQCFKIENLTGGSRHLNGDYDFATYYAGFPAFSRGDVWLFYDKSTSCWYIDSDLGSSRGWVSMRSFDPSPVPAADGTTKYTIPNGEEIPTQPHFVPYSKTVHIKDALIDFLRRRRTDPDLRSVPDKADGLMRDVLGPPKSFPRALDKADACEKWGGAKALVDVNRVTLVFESPAVLVFVFNLIEYRVKLMGGSVSRLSNFFIQDGRLAHEFRVPPCIHLNLYIDGWVFEVMLMFVDIEHLKHRLHKFYEVARATSAEELLIPVFSSF